MKHCLIVVDMQNDFVSGALGFKEAQAIVPYVEEKIKDALKRGDDVFFTQDTHEEDYLESEEGSHLPVKHCVKGTMGHDFVPGVKEYVNKGKVFMKSTFPSLALANYLEGKDYESIELCGLLSNICVLSNCIMAKSAKPNARIIVDAHATRALDDVTQQKTLDIMETLHIVVKNRG